MSGRLVGGVVEREEPRRQVDDGDLGHGLCVQHDSRCDREKRYAGNAAAHARNQTVRSPEVSVFTGVSVTSAGSEGIQDDIPHDTDRQTAALRLGGYNGAMTMPPEQESAVLALLERERANLVAQYERVPFDRRTTAPADGGWSAVQVIEHVARVETGVAKLIERGATMPRVATPGELADAALTAGKIQTIRDRATKVMAPERVRPAGEYTDATVLEYLRGSRAAMLAAYRGADAAVLDGLTWVHPFVGPLTLRAWFELIGHHDARHAQQLMEL